MALETEKYRVKIDFPWSLHEKGDVISVYKGIGVAYLVGVPDYGESEKFDVRDFPDIYELIEE